MEVQDLVIGTKKVIIGPQFWMMGWKIGKSDSMKRVSGKLIHVNASKQDRFLENWSNRRFKIFGTHSEGFRVN